MVQSVVHLVRPTPFISWYLIHPTQDQIKNKRIKACSWRVSKNEQGGASTPRRVDDGVANTALRADLEEVRTDVVFFVPIERQLLQLLQARESVSDSKNNERKDEEQSHSRHKKLDGQGQHLVTRAFVAGTKPVCPRPDPPRLSVGHQAPHSSGARVLAFDPLYAAHHPLL